jgi:hypothetical protein
MDMDRLDPNTPHHPVVVAHQARRAADLQLRIADAITTFAGSMQFVYIHAVVFALWMLFVESDPWPKLTLVVSLEAIFLSTFVMIGQNRQASFQQANAGRPHPHGRDSFPDRDGIGPDDPRSVTAGQTAWYRPRASRSAERVAMPSLGKIR